MSEVSEVFGVGGRTALYSLWGRISGSSPEGGRIGSRHGAEGSRLSVTNATPTAMMGHLIRRLR